MPNLQKPRGLTRKNRVAPSIIEREARIARKAGERITLVDILCPGLKLVIGARSASWSVTSRPRGLDPEGRRHTIKTVVIGDASDLPPEAARLAAVAMKREILAGRDPVAARRQQRQQEVDAARSAIDKQRADSAMLQRILNARPGEESRRAPRFQGSGESTLRDCADAFMNHGATGKALHRNQTAGNLRLAIDEMAASALKPADLDRERVADLVASRRHMPAVARHRHSAVLRMYKWLRSVHAADANPATDIQLPAPPAPRSNVPTAEAIQGLWRAADRLPSARGPSPASRSCSPCGGRNSPTSSGGTSS